MNLTPTELRETIAYQLDCALKAQAVGSLSRQAHYQGQAKFYQEVLESIEATTHVSVNGEIREFVDKPERLYKMYSDGNWILCDGSNDTPNYKPLMSIKPEQT